MNGDLKIIHGHGKLSNKESYHCFLKMPETLRTSIQKAINEKTEDDLKPLKSLTKTYNNLDFGSGFIKKKSLDFLKEFEGRVKLN
tara:strand:+ start:2269 stop:2523 length:255 start_codon:yes stop_codon:yes gene_type:complete